VFNQQDINIFVVTDCMFEHLSLWLSYKCPLL